MPPRPTCQEGLDRPCGRGPSQKKVKFFLPAFCSKIFWNFSFCPQKCPKSFFFGRAQRFPLRRNSVTRTAPLYRGGVPPCWTRGGLTPPPLHLSHPPPPTNCRRVFFWGIWVLGDMVWVLSMLDGAVPECSPNAMSNFSNASSSTKPLHNPTQRFKGPQFVVFLTAMTALGWCHPGPQLVCHPLLNIPPPTEAPVRLIHNEMLLMDNYSFSHTSDVSCA